MSFFAANVLNTPGKIINTLKPENIIRLHGAWLLCTVRRMVEWRRVSSPFSHVIFLSNQPQCSDEKCS